MINTIAQYIGVITLDSVIIFFPLCSFNVFCLEFLFLFK